MAGDSARGWLNQIITWTAAEDILDEAGLEPTQEAVDGIQAQLSSNPTAQELPQDMLDDVVRGAAAIESLSQIPAPTTEELEAMYAEAPASTGRAVREPHPRRDRGRGPGGARRAGGRCRLRRAGRRTVDRTGRGREWWGAGGQRRQRLPVRGHLPDVVRSRLHRRRADSRRRGAYGAGPEPVRVPRDPGPPLRRGGRGPDGPHRHRPGRRRPSPADWPRATSRWTRATAGGMRPDGSVVSLR